MFNLSSSDNIWVSQVFKLSSQQKFRLQRIISRGITRRQVILVLTDTTGGVLSRVWKTTFTKHRLDTYYDKSDQSLLIGGRLQSSNSASYRKGIQWSKRSYRVYTGSCFILDQRVPFRSCDKRFGSSRDAVRLRVFWESALFVNVHASTNVHKRWSHYRWGASCHLRPSLMSE